MKILDSDVRVLPESAMTGNREWAENTASGVANVLADKELILVWNGDKEQSHMHVSNGVST